MKIGDRIKARREILKMTQEDLAFKMGYKSRSTINKIELGINDVSQSKIIKLSKILKTSPAYLMGWSEKEENAKNSDIEKNLGLNDKENIIPTKEELEKGSMLFYENKNISDEDKDELFKKIQEYYFKERLKK